MAGLHINTSKATRAIYIIAFALLALLTAGSVWGQTGREIAANGDQLDSDLYLEIAKGDVLSHTSIHKFGAADDIGTSWTIVTSSKTYQTPTTPQALEAVSTSDSDSTGNAGLQSICVEGLGSGWQALTQCVNLRGTQAVNFDSTMFRVFRIYGNQSGTYATVAAASQVGTINVETQGTSTVWGTLEVESSFGFGQSLIGAYTVPRGYKAYVTGLDIEVESTKKPSITFFKRCNADDVSAPYTGIMRIQELFRGLDTFIAESFDAPLGPFTGPCDIGFFAKAPSGATTDIGVDFEIVLVKE